MKKVVNKFATLFLDIETSPNIVLSWRVGNKVNLTPENILEERKIICISYKWAGDKKIQTVDWGVNKQCDKKLLVAFSKVLEKADEVVGHNGDKYDIKFINGRLAFHNLPPLPTVATTDTLKLSRRVFYLNSQKLNYLGKFLGLGSKLSTGGYTLWKRVFIDKCPKALQKMIKYCERDVDLLEKVYNYIIKYSRNIHKGRALGFGMASCPACGSNKTHCNGKRILTSGITYQRHKCNHCGHSFKGQRL